MQVSSFLLIDNIHIIQAITCVFSPFLKKKGYRDMGRLILDRQIDDS